MPTAARKLKWETSKATVSEKLAMFSSRGALGQGSSATTQSDPSEAGTDTASAGPSGSAAPAPAQAAAAAPVAQAVKAADRWGVDRLVRSKGLLKYAAAKAKGTAKRQPNQHVEQ